MACQGGLFALAISLAGQLGQVFPFPAHPPCEITYPSVNVKNHGVGGDGVSDDTTALQALIPAHLRRGQILYFPNGTYLISDSLNYGATPSGLTLEGQSRSGTVIRLKDNAVGFATPSDAGAKPIIEGVRNSNGYASGFNLFIRNVTIPTGNGNPGAIGVRFTGMDFGF